MTTISLEKPKSQPRLNYPQAAPATLQAMLALSEVVKQGGLEESLLLLVAIRTSQINGCALCLEMHIRAAKAAGETEDRLNLLTAWREVDVYTGRERAALRKSAALEVAAPSHSPENRCRSRTVTSPLDRSLSDRVGFRFGGGRRLVDLFFNVLQPADDGTGCEANGGSNQREGNK
jgi:AhpD family alkylhydroperoxidase